jgi:hypothetical protein
MYQRRICIKFENCCPELNCPPPPLAQTVSVFVYRATIIWCTRNEQSHCHNQEDNSPRYKLMISTSCGGIIQGQLE